MKIDGHNRSLEIPGAGGHHAHKAKHVQAAATTSVATATAQTEQATTTVNLTSGVAATSTSPTAATAAESQSAENGRKVPPGLARVAARFESLGEAGRTRGQSNALAQIQRHLQRYADVQNLAPAAESGGSTTPVTPLPVPVVNPKTNPIAVPVDGAAGEAAAVGDVGFMVGTKAVSAEPVSAYQASSLVLQPA